MKTEEEIKAKVEEITNKILFDELEGEELRHNLGIAAGLNWVLQSEGI